ncbi:hypothetical protein CUR178_06027 [Leishmania enriettii]|uniref:Uncharacterized protein n=1 Tax=Leishmania enriettii TaxID=5663 RepID=A0A836KY24_LEIEN|nr:hypothetical protein CUR178_06027 [Leishmania enriettii]
MERNRCDRAPMVHPPRVCVALRWREARSWRMADEEKNGLSAERISPVASGIGVSASSSAPGSTHTHISLSPSASGSTASNLMSRVCVLRRCYPPLTSALSAPNVLHGGGHEHSRGDEVRLARNAGTIIGLGMRERECSAELPSLSSAPVRPATMEVVVQTPFIAVEGLGADSAAAASSDAQQRPVRAHHHSGGGDSTCLTYTDACLTERLADVIAKELLPGHTLPQHRDAGSHETHNASTACSAAAAPDNHEVLTFTMGPQGAANSSFLFGGTLGWPSRQRAPPATVSLSPQTTSGLFAAVLNRLFSTANVPADTRVVAAMSVTEVRDAAPLRHPSVLQRPRLTVDLLSGAVLCTESDESEGQDDSVDHPSDIPAACYVRVESAHDAMSVLYAALSCSIGWRRAQPLTDDVEHAEADASSSSPTSFAFLEPACEPLEERMCHTCVTLIVSCELLEPPQDEEAQRSMKHSSGGASHKRGASGHTAVLSAAPAGIWKLWDVAEPSVSCGYRSLSASSKSVKDGEGSSAAVRPSPVPVAGGCAASPPLPKPPLPWSSRYSLAALTHTCLSEVGFTLRSSALPSSISSVDDLIPPLRHDTSAALQIASSAVSSCSLVVPVCAVVAEATADDVNRDVLVAAAGWAALERERRREERQQQHQWRPRVRGLDNANAAMRVLQEYAVLLREFATEIHGTSEGSGTTAPLFSTPRSPWESLAASRLPVRNNEPGGSPISEVGHAARDPPAKPSVPTGAAVYGPPAQATSERSVALHVAVAPLGRLPTHTMAAGASAVGSMPLSINVTADADEPTAFRLPTCMKAEARSTAVMDGPDHVPDDAYAAARAEGALRITGEAALPTSLPATPPAGVAATCAAAATHAEEAQLQRFHALFESESFLISEEREVAALAEGVGQCVASSSMGTGDVVARNSRRKQQTPLRQQTPPVKKFGSPPSVLRTGRRFDPGVATQTSRSLKPLRAPLPSTPSHISAESAVHDSTAEIDPTAASLCPSQALLYDVTLSPQGEESLATEVGATPGRDATLDTYARLPQTPAPSLPPPDAALAAFLGPYCDEFVRLCDQMRADMRAWRAREAETLDQLSTLAEHHTHDIEKMAALQRRLAAASSTVVVTPGSKGASAVSDARGGGGDADSLLCNAAADGCRDLRDSCSAAFASASALIFEQLVKSEGKVAWLERQLANWRRCTREASALDASDGGAEAASLNGIKGSDEPALESSSSPPAVAEGFELGLRDDPTAPYVRQAKKILQRLLQRCTRAYAAAQQRGDRWHAQLAQEQAAKSVLQDRVAELEAELTSLCRQRSAVATFPHLHRPPAVRGDSMSNDAQAVSASRPRTHTPPDRLVASPPPPSAALGFRSLHYTFDDADADQSLLTAVPASPIASDTASSLPSSSVSRRLQRRGGAAAGCAALWDRESAQRLATDGISSAGEPVGTDALGVVAPQLAVLLSRAVQVGDAAAPPATVDLHIGSAMASSISAVAPAPFADIHARASSAVSCRSEDSPLRPAASCSSASAPLYLAGGAPVVGSRAEYRGSSVESGTIRQCRSPRSRLQHKWCANSATTPHSTLHCSADRVGEDTCAGRTSHHHDGAEAAKISAGALVRAASHPPRLQCHVTSGDELDLYPSAALEALGRAATQLEAEAVRLCCAAYDPLDSVSGTPSHTPAIEHRQLHRGDEVAVRREGDARELYPSLPSSLCQSMGQLRSAAEAVQREARDAAVRERAYLSAILFSTDAGAE